MTEIATPAGGRLRCTLSPALMEQSLATLFRQRKESFVQSLETAISVVVQKENVQRIFQDKSADGVPESLCRTVVDVITSEREVFLSALIDKLAMINACFGEARVNDIVTIGRALDKNEGMDESRVMILKARLADIIAPSVGGTSESDAISRASVKYWNMRQKAEKVVSELSNELDETKTCLAKVKERYERLKAANGVLKRSLRQQSSEEASQGAWKTIENELHPSNRKTEVVSGDWPIDSSPKSRIRSLAQQNEQLLASINGYDERLRARHADNIKLKARLDEMTREREEQVVLVATLTRENKELQMSLKAARNDSEYRRWLESPSSFEKESRGRMEDMRRRLAAHETSARENERLIAQLTRQLSERASAEGSETLLQNEMGKTERRLMDAENEIERLTTENEELRRISESSIEAENTLKGVREDLKLTKQRLVKAETELQASSTPSQRRQSDMLRDMSRELREINLKISRVVAQAGKSFQLESLEDIPRAMADAKRQIANANSSVVKMRNLLQLKSDADVMAEMRRLRQQASTFDEFLKDMGIILGADTLSKCIKSIVELKTQLDELKARETRTCELLDADSGQAMIKRLSKTSETLNRMKNICSLLQTSDEARAVEKVMNLLSLQQTLASEIGSCSVEGVERFFGKMTTMVRREERVLGLLSVSSAKNIETALEAVVTARDQYVAIKDKLGIMEADERVQQLLIADHVCRRAVALLKLDEYSDITTALENLAANSATMNELEEQLMLELAVVSSASITGRVKDLREKVLRQDGTLKQLTCDLGIEDENEIIDKVQKLMKQSTVLSDLQSLSTNGDIASYMISIKAEIDNNNMFIDKLYSQLDVDGKEQIVPAICLLVDQKNMLESLTMRYPSSFKSGDVKADLEALIYEVIERRKQLTHLEDVMNCQDEQTIDDAVAVHRDQLASTSAVFSKLMSIITSSPTEISFPLDASVELRLMKLIDDQKARLEAERADIDALMNRAVLLGYDGKGLSGAIDVVVAACTETERQTLADKLHSDLLSVRASTAKEKTLLERQNEKFRRRIGHLQDTLGDVRVRSEARESELTRQLEEAENSFSSYHKDSETGNDLDRLSALRKRQREALVHYTETEIAAGSPSNPSKT